MTWWKPSSWDRWQKLTVLAAVLAAGAYVLQILAGFNSWATWSKWLITAGGALFAASALWLPIHEQKHQVNENVRLLREQEQLVQERVHEALREVVLPVTHYVHLIGGLAPALRTNREEALKGKAVMAATRGSLEISGARAAYYDFTPRLLRCAANHSPGSDNPDDLTSRTEHGRHIISHAKQGRGLLESDLGQSAVSWPTDAKFNTFAMHPVHAGSTLFGVLTLDAPTPGSLDDRHARLLEILAKSLSAGILLCR